MLSHENIILYLLVCLLLGILALSIIPARNVQLLRIIGLSFSFVTFLISLFLWIWFDPSTTKFQFVKEIVRVESLNLNLVVGVDNISVLLILFTCFFTFVCVLASWIVVKSEVKEYLISFLIMEFFLISVFSIRELVLFYIFFETVLIFSLLAANLWAGKKLKKKMELFFFVYTVFISGVMLLGILCIFNQVGTTNYSEWLKVIQHPQIQRNIWMTFYTSFAVKLSMFTFVGVYTAVSRLKDIKKCWANYWGKPV
jgi:NADH:ubiquinone oxidoreductase subunit 4 (subunit M)